MLSAPTKLQMALTAIVIATVGTAHGLYDDQTHIYPLEGCEPQPSCEPCEPCCGDCCGQLFVGAELLYFRAFEGGLSNVCDGIEITNTTDGGITTSTLEGRGHDPHFNWNPGYRIGVGYVFANSQCGVGAYWTHFNSHTRGGDDENEHHWNIDFDVVDALFGCEYALSDCFSFSPFAGVRGARIDQKLRANFQNTVDGVVTSTSTGLLREDFRGIGPVFGAEGAWSMGCGLSLYGNISAAVLYGRFHVRADQNDAFSTVLNVNHIRRHTQASQLVLDVGFGIRWNTCLCDGTTLAMQLGLEQHRYFNHNQFCEYGDLNLDGVSFAVGIGF